MRPAFTWDGGFRFGLPLVLLFPSASGYARLIRIPAIARVMRIYISIASTPNSALYTISLGKFNFFNQQGDTIAGATTTAPALEQNAMLFFDSNGLRADFAQKSNFEHTKRRYAFAFQIVVFNSG